MHRNISRRAYFQICRANGLAGRMSRVSPSRNQCWCEGIIMNVSTVCMYENTPYFICKKCFSCRKSGSMKWDVERNKLFSAVKGLVSLSSICLMYAGCPPPSPVFLTLGSLSASLWCPTGTVFVPCFSHPLSSPASTTSMLQRHIACFQCVVPHLIHLVVDF